MKSSTRNLPNVQDLTSDKRFDALVKRQKAEHDYLIDCHNKEIQTLRDSVSSAMEKFQSLFDDNTHQLHEFKINVINHIGFLTDRMVSNEALIVNQRKMIESLNEEMINLNISFANKTDVEKVKKSFQEQINVSTNNHLNSFQDFQRELKDLFISLKNDLSILSSDIAQKLAQLTEKTESNFIISRLEKDGVLKEIRVYEKAIFIIDKKIENIYTLIERINKRGEACPKQE